MRLPFGESAHFVPEGIHRGLKRAAVRIGGVAARIGGCLVVVDTGLNGAAVRIGGCLVVVDTGLNGAAVRIGGCLVGAAVRIGGCLVVVDAPVQPSRDPPCHDSEGEPDSDHGPDDGNDDADHDGKGGFHARSVARAAVVDVAALPVVNEPGPGAAVVESATVSGSRRCAGQHRGLALRLRSGSRLVAAVAAPVDGESESVASGRMSGRRSYARLARGVAARGRPAVPNPDEGSSEMATVQGTTGDDTLDGGHGDDSLSGGYGHDTLGGNRMYGGYGNDSLSGGYGNNILYGGYGNDTLYGGKGSNTLWGGAGSDTFVVGAGGATVYVSGYDPAESIMHSGGLTEYSTATLEGGEVKRTYTDGSIVVLQYPGRRMDGTRGNDTLYGWRDNDSLDGGSGNDALSGGAGDDFLYVGRAVEPRQARGASGRERRKRRRAGSSRGAAARIPPAKIPGGPKRLPMVPSKPPSTTAAATSIGKRSRARRLAGGQARTRQAAAGRPAR